MSRTLWAIFWLAVALAAAAASAAHPRDPSSSQPSDRVQAAARDSPTCRLLQQAPFSTFSAAPVHLACLNAPKWADLLQQVASSTNTTRDSTPASGTPDVIFVQRKDFAVLPAESVSLTVVTDVPLLAVNSRRVVPSTSVMDTLNQAQTDLDDPLMVWDILSTLLGGSLDRWPSQLVNDDPTLVDTLVAQGTLDALLLTLSQFFSSTHLDAAAATDAFCNGKLPALLTTASRALALATGPSSCPALASTRLVSLHNATRFSRPVARLPLLAVALRGAASSMSSTDIAARTFVEWLAQLTTGQLLLPKYGGVPANARAWSLLPPSLFHALLSSRDPSPIPLPLTVSRVSSLARDTLRQAYENVRDTRTPTRVALMSAAHTMQALWSEHTRVSTSDHQDDNHESIDPLAALATSLPLPPILVQASSGSTAAIAVPVVIIGLLLAAAAIYFYCKHHRKKHLLAIERYKHWQIDYDDLEDVEEIDDVGETFLATYDHCRAYGIRLNLSDHVSNPRQNSTATSLQRGGSIMNNPSSSIDGHGGGRRRSLWFGSQRAGNLGVMEGEVSSTAYRAIAESFVRLKDLRHPNLVEFYGVTIQPRYMVVEYCAKGSLYDVLRLKSQIKLDLDFKVCMAMDAARGMMFLHNNEIAHRNLRSTKVLVDHRFVCKISGFFIENTSPAEADLDDLDALYWVSPEILKAQLAGGPYLGADRSMGLASIPSTSAGLMNNALHHRNSTSPRRPVDPSSLDLFKADVYSFAIILWELLTGDEREPYGDIDELDPQLLCIRITSDTDPLRPEIPVAADQREEKFIAAMEQCWSPQPTSRPTFSNVLSMLQSLTGKESGSILEKMAFMLEKWSESLEDVVEQRTQELAEEKKRAEALLHNILPRSVAERLQREGDNAFIADLHAEATVFFSDIVGFTAMSHGTPPSEVVQMLNGLFTVMDSLADKYGLEKIKTIGDAYMAACGCPQAREDHCERVALFALEALQIKLPGVHGKPLQMRMGIHTGPVIAGVVGTRKFAYDLWGDTVNTASRMESNGVPGRVCVSEAVNSVLADKFYTEKREPREIKGLGMTYTYLLGPLRDTRRSAAMDESSGMSKWALLQSGDNKRRLMVLGAGKSPNNDRAGPSSSSSSPARSLSTMPFSDGNSRRQAIRDRFASGASSKVRTAAAHAQAHGSSERGTSPEDSEHAEGDATGAPAAGVSSPAAASTENLDAESSPSYVRFKQRAVPSRTTTTFQQSGGFNHRARASMRLRNSRHGHAKDSTGVRRRGEPRRADTVDTSASPDTYAQRTNTLSVPGSHSDLTSTVNFNAPGSPPNTAAGDAPGDAHHDDSAPTSLFDVVINLVERTRRERALKASSLEAINALATPGDTVANNNDPNSSSTHVPVSKAVSSQSFASKGNQDADLTIDQLLALRRLSLDGTSHSQGALAMSSPSVVVRSATPGEDAKTDTGTHQPTRRTDSIREAENELHDDDDDHVHVHDHVDTQDDFTMGIIHPISTLSAPLMAAANVSIESAPSVMAADLCPTENEKRHATRSMSSQFTQSLAYIDRVNLAPSVERSRSVDTSINLLENSSDDDDDDAPETSIV